jgi:2-polyprenyl-3-methyl-5-hydroxy-6-metoxy-1,4-benzoquinol methylase
MHTFSNEENKRFWQSNQAAYQGEFNAPALYFLIESFLSDRILDAGAGDGSLVRFLRQKRPAAQVTGVDFAPKSDDVEEGDASNLRYSGDAFDSVVCSEVIEHTNPEETRSILKELNRVLCSGGHLILTTPFAEDLEASTVCCPCCNEKFHRWGHQQRFLEADHARLVEAAGFTCLFSFPIKYNRVRRFRFLGAKFFRSERMKNQIRRSSGKRTLVTIAQKPAKD